MAKTESTMLALGTVAPEFSLKDTVSEKTLNLHSMKGEKGTIIFFICNHCPFVVHVNPEIVNLAHDYQPKGFGFIAISSNDIENYPQDGPQYMKLKAKAEGYIFPYLFDETQDVARAFDAACTPDFYLFNENLKLVYRGQLDNSRPDNGLPLNGKDIRNAMDALLHKTTIDPDQKPSIGCNIKWNDNSH